MVDERTTEEVERLKQIVDGLPALDMLNVTCETVGTKRTVELMGWAVIWGLSGETSGTDLRNRLVAHGMTQRSAYRAIMDFRRVSDRLLEMDGYQGKSVFSSLRLLAKSIA